MMEEELNYATVVFKDTKPPQEKNEESTIYSTIKREGPTRTSTRTSPTADSKAAAQPQSRVLAVCLGILCVLLVLSISAIIYLSVVMNKQTADLNNLTVQNQQLITYRNMLEKQKAELSRDNDDYNWTLGVILQFNTFPVNAYCPQRKCQPCQNGWIWFQEKCYLFYNEINPWKTWYQSRQYCQDTAADLVVVDSPQEQEFISNNTEYYLDMFHGFWLGLRETSDKNWFWVDQRKDTLGYWIKGGLGTAGPCALMIPGRTFNASWDPAECIMQNKFICEGQVLIRSN